MLKKRYLTGKVLAGITFGMCCAGLSAQQFERDIQLARELNAINLQDYAQDLIDGLLAENQNSQELLAQRAENFVAQGKMEEAMEIINGLDKNSPAYYNAQAGIGIFYVRQRKFAEGIPMLLTVKEYATRNNCQGAYKMALAWLLTAYQDQGKAAEAQELLAILAKLEEGNTERSDREMKLAQARYGLSCIDNMKKTFAERLGTLQAEYNAKWKAAATDAAKKKTLDWLEGQRKNHWNNYTKAIMGGNASAAQTHGANYYKVYREIAKTIGMDENAAVELASLQKVKALQPARLKLILKGRTSLQPNEVKILAIKDNNDWQDVVYQAITDMEEVQWGGLDTCFFMAAANLMQAYYHLGQYEKALTIYRKNKNLFKQCDEEYKKNGEPLENSPTAEARIWEGFNCYALAKQLEKTDKKKSLQYYKRAFVAFGQLLMNYPKHRDGAKNYPILLEIVEKLKALAPEISDSLDTQLARVPKPELKAATNADVEIEELVPPLPAQQFKDGNAIASDNMKKDRTANKSTDADWEKCRGHFKVVDAELTPILQGNRLSTGLPKVLNHLLIANGYLGDIFKFKSLVQLSEFMYRDNDLVHHGIVVGANALWMYAERAEAAGNHEMAIRLQDEAMKVYDLFLRIAPSHPYAPNVAMRIASMEFVRANRIGELINEKQKAGAPVAEVNELKKEWLAGFDRALVRFEFVFNNFAHREEFIIRAYELAIEAYRLTNRLEEASEMCTRFCAIGTDDAFKTLKIKVDSASLLYRHILENLKQENENLRAEIALIVEPEKVADLPETLLNIVKKAQKQAEEQDAAAKAADEASAQEQTPAQPKAQEQTPAQPKTPGKTAKEIYEEALAAFTKVVENKESTDEQKLQAALLAQSCYEAAIAEYNKAVEEYKVLVVKREQMQAKIAENEAKIPVLSRKAIQAIKELRSWLTPGSKILEKAKKQVQADIEKQTKKLKTAEEKAQVTATLQQEANSRIATEIYRADTMIPWLCEDAGDIDSSIAEFLSAANKYKDSELAKEQADPKYRSFAPGYLLKAGKLCSENDKEEQARKIFDQLSREYSDRPEGKDVQFFLAMSLYKGKKYDLAIDKFFQILNTPDLRATLAVSSFRQLSSELYQCSEPQYRAKAALVSLEASNHLLSLLNQEIKLKEWVGPKDEERLRSDPEALQNFVTAIRATCYKNKAKACLILAEADPGKKADYLRDALNAYLAVIPDNMRHKSNDQDYYEILFKRAEIRCFLGDYEAASKDLIAASRRANSGSSKGPVVVGFYYKAQNELGKLYMKQGETKKAHGAFMIVAALNFAKPEKVEPPPVEKMDAKARLEYTAETEGAAALEEAVFLSAKTASDLGDTATAKRMAGKYVEYYPDGKFIDEAKSLQ